MSDLTRTPATARTDVPGGIAPATGAPTRTGISATAVRRIGIGLAIGATAFATTFVLGDPQDTGAAGNLTDAGGLVFQLGLFGLLSAMRRTRATGDGRFARGMLWAVTALLVPATLWSILSIVVPAAYQGTWFYALDAFWPLSMLGMAVVGVTVAVAGRWTGALRFWPAVAETWALVCVPILVALGPGIGNPVGGLHMLLGYGVLGVLLAARPERTGSAG